MSNVTAVTTSSVSMTTNATTYTTLELYLLETYMTLCSILVVVLNSLLLFLLVTKVKMSRCPSCIPVMLMSVLGLIQGLSSTLPITVSLFGQLDLQLHPSLCSSIPVLQGHVLVSYIANICNVAVEAAWAMSHRFTYHPGHGLIYLILAGAVSLLLPIPLTAVHLSGRSDQNLDVEEPSPRFYLDQRLQQCVRDWIQGQQAGFLFYVAFSLVLDVLVVLCLIACSIVVQVYISKSKKEFHRSTFQDSKARKRAQDVSTAKSAIYETVGSAVIWLPSVLGTAALAGTKGNTSLLSEIGTWTSHSIYWISPLLCLLNNTALRRAFVCLKMDVAKVLRRARN